MKIPNKENLIIGNCYLVKDLYLFKVLDPNTGHLSCIDKTRHKIYNVICLDIVNINFITIVILFCEEGIRYAYKRIFLSSIVVDVPPENS
jgi:hypothetical protein